jgi:hypothetical protein
VLHNAEYGGEHRRCDLLSVIARREGRVTTRTLSNARADVLAGRLATFDQAHAQDAFLTTGNAALAPDCVNGDEPRWWPSKVG